MKGSLYWKFAYLCCVLTGILAGYGMFSLTAAKEDISTKDNTLVRESGDSVFFDEEPELPVPTGLLIPTLTSTPIPIPTSTPIPTPVSTPTPEPTQTITEIPTPTAVPTPVPTITPVPAEVLPKLPEITLIPEEIRETITYPAKIFGQTPVINPSDTYVSYFEFCYDLIAMVEQEVAARGLNINTLMTKFALKALLCGVDIEQLDINAPIPRRLAALCLWLAAQVLNESGCDTSSRSAGDYVTDITSCSSSERKAIAYLYEQGVLKGYQVKGQRFYPQDGLKTEAGKAWLSGIKHCWK